VYNCLITYTPFLYPKLCPYPKPPQQQTPVRIPKDPTNQIAARLARPDRGTGTGPDRTDFSAVRSQSKRLDRETVSIFGPDRTETFVAQAFINKLG
jgi:hypothetical protein